VLLKTPEPVTTIWRIATETRHFAATDLSGKGAAMYPGRWNEEQHPIVYASSSISLAMLETVAHLDTHGLPLNRVLVAIDVPAEIWERKRTLTPDGLEAAWSVIPAGRTSIDLGTRWLKSCTSVLLCVPSAIVPEEFVVLINPLHPDASQLSARAVRKIQYEGVLRK
jgi:RES domain-containing protein